MNSKTHPATQPAEEQERRYPAAQLREQIVAVLQAWGMSAAHAEVTARLMVQTDLLGVDSHGISMLPHYDRLRGKGLVVAAEPVRVRRFGATSLWDGQAGLGHPVAHAAMQDAISQARLHGIAFAGVRNSHHFGAAGVYARLASEAGLIGIVTSSAKGVLVVPTRASVPVLGTNPIAWAVPAGEGRDDVVLDIATSTSAANKVRVRALRDQPIPAGWVVDEGGQPVEDPQAAHARLFERQGGGLTPLGSNETLASHKGYGLGLFAQIVGASLNGGAFAAATAADPSLADGPANIGHSFIVIDPAALVGLGAFTDSVAGMADFLHGVVPADPELPVLVPGDLEAAHWRERQAGGVPLPGLLVEQLRAVSTRAGVPFVLNPVD